MLTPQLMMSISDQTSRVREIIDPEMYFAKDYRFSIILLVEIETRQLNFPET